MFQVLGDPVQQYVSSVQGTDSFSVDPDGYVRLARTVDYDTQNRYVFQASVPHNLCLLQLNQEGGTTSVV